jgi:hypothetical protein
MFFQIWLIVQAMFFVGLNIEKRMIAAANINKKNYLLSFGSIVVIGGAILSNLFFFVYYILFAFSGSEIYIAITGIQLFIFIIELVYCVNERVPILVLICSMLNYYNLFLILSLLNKQCTFSPETNFEQFLYFAIIFINFLSVLTNLFWSTGRYERSLQHLTIIFIYSYIRDLFVSWGGYYSIEPCLNGEDEFGWDKIFQLLTVALSHLLFIQSAKILINEKKNYL